jgi:hypothetical protein
LIEVADVPGQHLIKARLALLAIITYAEGKTCAQQTSVQSSNPAAAGAQSKSVQDGQNNAQAPSESVENDIDARESNAPPKRDLVRWNEYRGPYFTARAGFGFLVDFAGYAQDDESKQQIKMLPGEKLRDFRFLVGGKLIPKWDRSLT